jgi:hypothetical protein
MCKGLTFIAVLLLWVAAAPGQSASSNSQTQTQPTQNSTRTNPENPSTPLGAPPVQNSDQSKPGPQNSSSTASQPGSSQPNATPPANISVQSVPAALTGADQAPVNTEVRAVLDTPLSTRTSKPGDLFTATITDPVHGSNGAVIVPAGARLEGEVAEGEQLKAVQALRDRTQLSLRFRDVVLPTGQAVPLSATLISVNKTNGKTAKQTEDATQVQAGREGRDVAAGIGTAANGSAGPALVFGSPLKGLAVGALSGGGYVLATKAKQVNLPAQTGLVIRLDQPLSISASSTPMQ